MYRRLNISNCSALLQQNLKFTKSCIPLSIHRPTEVSLLNNQKLNFLAPCLIRKSDFHTSLVDFKDSKIPTSRFKGWTTVFRFPYIVPMHIMCRLKIYQTAIAGVVCPVSLVLMANGHVSPPVTALFVGLFGTAAVMLMGIGQIFKRIVGFIYLSPCKNEVIISHLTWWGNRKDFRVFTREIIPIDEMGENPKDYYWKIKIYDEDDFYLISTFLGGIEDKEAFEHIFGKNIEFPK